MTRYKTIATVLTLFFIGLALSALLEQLTGRGVRGVVGDPSVLLAQINHAPQRVACMVPSVTETVFALEAISQVVGVSDFCTYPPEVSEKPRLGGFFNPNFERLTALEPDLIITQGLSENLTAFCRHQNTPLLHVEMSDVDTILQDTILLGDVLGRPERARQLVFQLRQQLDHVRRTVAARPRPTVFFSLYRTGGATTGLSTVGGDVYLSELIELAGGRNVFHDLRQPYPQVSKEALLKRQPDVIIEPLADSNLTAQERQQRLDDWKTIGSLKCIETGRVYFPAEGSLLIPGPRLADAASLIAGLLHPEVADEL